MLNGCFVSTDCLMGTGARAGATPVPRRDHRSWLLLVAISVVTLVTAIPGWAADYTGPMIDAHSHLPSAAAIDAYVAAMKRHDVARVVLLGVGGVQAQDAEWIGAAARKYPDRVIRGVPVSDPTSDATAARLDAALADGQARALGEVHVRQVSRQIDRSPDAPAFLKILEVAARRKVPVVIHQELDDKAAAALEKALAAVPGATLVLAHGGGATPARLATLLERHANLRVDLSGMHFQRTPHLATETGPLDTAWKTLIEKMPDRFLMGIDVWAPRLFEPAMLDKLMRWTRRILGELRPDVAERVAYGNAAALFGVK
jgi:predicted TIM-barrel fold metal-dependent hydrolase